MSEKERKMAPEMEGFRSRLVHAVETRKLEVPGFANNRLAKAADVDSGNLSKLLDGTKRHPTASTAIQLARALEVELVWFLTGKGPSGLDRQMSAAGAAALTGVSRDELQRLKRSANAIGQQVDKQVESLGKSELPKQRKLQGHGGKKR